MSDSRVSRIKITDFIARFDAYPFAEKFNTEPWKLTASAIEVISTLILTLGPEYRLEEGVAIHKSAVVERGAVIKPPAVIGPACFVAGSAYLRGGVFLDSDCTVGPAAELKSTFMLRGSKLAHLNFVGDSILGERVNCEAGSMIANYRNELEDKRIRIAFKGDVIETGVDKFGALVGDGVRLGCNAVVAPGALVPAGTIVPRLGLVDQAPA